MNATCQTIVLPRHHPRCPCDDMSLQKPFSKAREKVKRRLSKIGTKRESSGTHLPGSNPDSNSEEGRVSSVGKSRGGEGASESLLPPMPHPIIEIDELVRQVIDNLIEISLPTAVSFALTCRSLEEPTLSSVWKRQSSLTELVKVLPQHTWVEKRGNIRFLVS